MPSLSLDKEVPKDCKPMAVVKGGHYDKEVLCLHEGMEKGKKPTPTLHRGKYAGDLKGVKPAERTKIFGRLEEAQIGRAHV